MMMRVVQSSFRAASGIMSLFVLLGVSPAWSSDLLQEARRQQVVGRTGYEKASVDVVTTGSDGRPTESHLLVEAIWVGYPQATYGSQGVRRSVHNPRQLLGGSEWIFDRGIGSQVTMYRRDAAVDPVAAERSTTTHLVTLVDLEQLSEAEQWPVLTGGGLETALLWGQLPDGRLVLDALVEVGPDGPSDLKVTEADGLAVVEATFRNPATEATSGAEREGGRFRVVLDPGRGMLVTELSGSWRDHNDRPVSGRMVVREARRVGEVWVPVSGFQETQWFGESGQVVYRRSVTVDRIEVDPSRMRLGAPMSMSEVPDGTIVVQVPMTDALPRIWQSGRVVVGIDRGDVEAIEDEVSRIVISGLGFGREGVLVGCAVVTAGATVALVVLMLMGGGGRR